MLSCVREGYSSLTTRHYGLSESTPTDGENVTSKNPIDHTGTQPAGAVFHRCALQVNPRHYAGTFRGQETGGDTESHANAIVEKAVELGVSVLAVTDHNGVSDVPAFRSAAEGRDVTIFPGFELSSSEGVHVLCIYPQDTAEDQLGRFLGEFGITRTDPSSDPSSKTCVEILAKVQTQGGISIAAHVTTDNGLFRVLSGRARIKAWRREELLAIQIPGPVKDLPQDIRQIVENKNPEYRRTSAADNLGVAVVNAKDVVKPEDLEIPSATCRIKMSDVSIEGLRQAFLDPGSRIRLASDPEPEEHAELISLSWEGGFLDGTAFRFNPNLNVLIGGRGAGKSTVVESLRYVLGLEPVGEEARKARDGIVRHVLRSGTKISLLVRSRGLLACAEHASRTEQTYRIERTVPNPPVVREEHGEGSDLLPEEILPRVEVYGQHEISELTRSGENLTRLLHRFVKQDVALGRRKADLRRSLEKTRRSILDVRADLRQIDERLAALPGVEETLKRFRDAGLEGRLREQSLLVREERVLDSIPERLETFRECLNLLRQELPIDRLFLSQKSLADLPGKEILAGADAILESLNADLEKVAQRLETALQQAENGVTGVRSRWNQRKNEVQDSYQKILRELQKSAVDAEEFIRLRRKIEELRPLRERRPLPERLEKEHTSRRSALLAEWEDVKAEEFRLLDRAAKTVSKKLRNHVGATVTAAGNRDPLFDVLKAKIGGRLSEAIDKLKQAPDLSLPEFVRCCRTGAKAIHETYALPMSQAERLAGASPEVFMHIEELELPATTAIRLNTAPAGDPPQWQALEELSTGQKATAVLLLLLLESDAPLIVDQPEDDLDNRFITESIVPRMREEKRRRQFVFSTHNANVPVLGDAEMILGLTAAGGPEGGTARIAPEHIGSIDAPPVRELIEEVLEGGKEAFERRRRKYGF